MEKRKLRINGHSHLLPYPEEIPQFMKDKGIFWVDKDRKYMLQKDWNKVLKVVKLSPVSPLAGTQNNFLQH